MVAAEASVPALPIEVVLLYKSKAPRPEDDTDFAAALPHLSRRAADWLVRALHMVDPGHRWMEALRARRG